MQFMYCRGAFTALSLVLILLCGSTCARAESIMKQCGDKWSVIIQAGEKNGQTWPEFLAKCRSDAEGYKAKGVHPASEEGRTIYFKCPATMTFPRQVRHTTYRFAIRGGRIYENIGEWEDLCKSNTFSQ
jgi:hypothetical protein